MPNCCSISKAPPIHIIIINNNNEIQTFGDNQHGQCDVPNDKLVNRNVMEVSAGYGFSLILTEDGCVVEFGRNDHGQCDVPEQEEP